MERDNGNRWIRETRYATKDEAKTMAQILLNLKENQFELESIKPKNLK